MRLGYSARPMSKSTRQRLLELMIARIGKSALAAGLGYSVMPDGKLIALIDLIDDTGEQPSLTS
jgi:hypothetical protein